MLRVKLELMLKKLLAVIILGSLFLAQTAEASEVYTFPSNPPANITGLDDCSTINASIQILNLPPDTADNGSNITNQYVSSTSKDISVHVSFSDTSKIDTKATYAVLISSAASAGTPAKYSPLASLPIVGGLLTGPSTGGKVALSVLFPPAALLLGIGAFVQKFSGSAPPGPGDIPLPIGNDDSESSPQGLIDGTGNFPTDFNVSTLTRVGPHYIKIKEAGNAFASCVDKGKIINVLDANDVSLYDCKNPHSLVGACMSGSGQYCKDSSGRDQPGVISTAIGCIPTKPADFINGVLGFVTRAAGGVALLLMAFGAIGIITSGGNAEALKSAQGRFVNAVVGLLVIILAVTLLQIIGVDILSIPGFGR